MISAINNNYQVQNKTNFGAVTRIVGIHVNGAMSNNEKEWESIVNHTINALMKRDKAEPRNIDAQKINGAIRAAFQSRISDYTVPPAYRFATRTLTDNPRFLVRSLEDNYKGIKSLYILTGKDARRLEDASMKIKEANSIRPYPEQKKDKALVAQITAQREAALAKARYDYGQTSGAILRDAKGSMQDVELFGAKGKSKTKVTPQSINFKKIEMELPPSTPPVRQARVQETPKPNAVASSSNALLVSEGLKKADASKTAPALVKPSKPKKSGKKPNPNQTTFLNKLA